MFDHFAAEFLLLTFWLGQTLPSQAVSRSLPFLPAMCQSRCLKEHEELPSCMKPCLELKLYTPKNIKNCKKLCLGSNGATVNGTISCAKSCNFLKSLLTGKKPLDSCPMNTKTCSVPASPHSLIVTDKNSSLSVLSWSSPHQSWAYDTVFVIGSRHIKQRTRPKEGSLGPWMQMSQTTQLSLALSMKDRTLWYQFQVVSVNQFGASRPSQSDVLRVAAHKPSSPRGFKVSSMKVVTKGSETEAEIELVWKKPINLDLPVHRYRVYWSERLHPHEYTTELVDLREYHHRVPGTIHAYRLTGLKANRTYLLELQTICLWRSKRLKSDRVFIEIVTPMKAVRGAPEPKFDSDQSTKRNSKTPAIINRIPTDRVPTKGQSIKSDTTVSPPTTSGVQKTVLLSKNNMLLGTAVAVLLLLLVCQPT